MRETLTEADARVLAIANTYIAIQMEARSLKVSDIASGYWRIYHEAASRALAAYKPGKKKPRKGGK